MMVTFSSCCRMLRATLALALILSLGKAPAMFAQSSAMASGQPPKALRIVILDGEDALNNIRQRTAREPIVQVEDENHRPVAGAVVVFSIRKGGTGAGGSFAGGPALAVVTGLDGQAVAHGIVLNSIQGAFTITVTATAAGITANALLTQTNVLGPAGSSNGTQQAQSSGAPGASTTTTTAAHHGLHLLTAHFWTVTGVAAAGAAAVATTVVLTRNNGATISPGTGTIRP